MGAFWRRVVGDTQLRWLGPEKGVIHLATARGRECRLGSLGEGRAQAALEAPRRHVLRRRSCAASTFATSPTRSLLRRRSTLLRKTRAKRGARSGDPALPAIPPTRRRPVGSATRDEKIRRSVAKGLADGWSALQDQGRRAISQATIAARRIVREEIGPDRQADDGREPGVGRGRGHRRRCRQLARFRSLVDRGADEPRRRARSCEHRAGRSRRSASPPASTSRTASSSSSSCRRTRSLLPNRQLPARGRQRGARGDPARGEVRHPRLPARRRRRAVRVRAASRDLRLHLRSAARSRTGSWSTSITCTSTSATRRWSSRAAIGCRSRRIQHRHASRVARRVRVPRRAGLGDGPKSQRSGPMTVSFLEAGSGRRPARASSSRSIAIAYSRVALLTLRTGPALILLLLVIAVALTTPSIPDEPATSGTSSPRRQ